MIHNKLTALLLALATAAPLAAQGAGKVVPIKYGDMDRWVVRHIKESGIRLLPLHVPLTISIATVVDGV